MSHWCLPRSPNGMYGPIWARDLSPRSFWYFCLLSYCGVWAWCRFVPGVVNLAVRQSSFAPYQACRFHYLSLSTHRFHSRQVRGKNDRCLGV